MTSTAWPAGRQRPVRRRAGEPAQPAGRKSLGDRRRGDARTPLWGRWHAARDRLDTTTAAKPVWFNELNSDPRHRVAAGLGAEIIRRNDQQLMAAAWDQVEGVKDANAELGGPS